MQLIHDIEMNDYNVIGTWDSSRAAGSRALAERETNINVDERDRNVMLHQPQYRSHRTLYNS